MKLTVERHFKGAEYTIGRLYIDGEYFCDTLENPVREEKVKGTTAIPAGNYPVTLDVVSPRFGKLNQYSFCGGKLPRLLNVSDFDGVLIHIGNYPKDTEGCILVGKNTVKGAVMGSTATFQKLYNVLENAIGKIEIEIL